MFLIFGIASTVIFNGTCAIADSSCEEVMAKKEPLSSEELDKKTDCILESMSKDPKLLNLEDGWSKPYVDTDPFEKIKKLPIFLQPNSPLPTEDIETHQYG